MLDPLGLWERPESVRRRGSGFITRSNTSEFTSQQSDESDSRDSSGYGTSSRRIALAKEILAEAAYCYYERSNLGLRTSSPLPGGSGSVGPLLSMLEVADQAGSDAEKVRQCLDTLGFLMQDRASCRTAEALDGVGIILGVLKTFNTNQDGILASALTSLTALVKHDDQDKVKLWQHKSKDTLIDLINPSQPKWLLSELMLCVSKTAFLSIRTLQHQQLEQLLEPRLVGAFASLLHPTRTSPLILQKALQFLGRASQCARPCHMMSWNAAIFNLVPLLTFPTSLDSSTSSTSTSSSSNLASGSMRRTHGSCRRLSDCGIDPEPSWSVTESALQPLLNLSEIPEFHNALFASGCISPSLSLLMHLSTERPALISATCLLANLTDSPLIQQHLSREAILRSLITILRGSHCSEVTVGLLYILGRLALGYPRVGAVLRKFGTLQALHHVLSCFPDDEEMSQGVSQLLTLLGCAHSNKQYRVHTAQEHAVALPLKLKTHASPDDDATCGSGMRIIVLDMCA